MIHINEDQEVQDSGSIDVELPWDEESAEESQERAPYSDFDGAWKRILDDYLPDFIEFFFPKVYPQIDWSREYEVLDQELHKVAPSGKTHKRLTDKLIKVWRIDGSEHWVLIHIEIQSQQEIGFEQRVYVYFYRLRDLRNLPVATFVVLGDTTKEWKPSQYQEELWDTKLRFEYPVVKLRDYWERWDELEQSKNPFATVVMAHLQTQKSRKNPALRYNVKLNLTRRLYRLGYNREQITNLFRFIDWVMWLPKELEPNFWREVVEIEESAERRRQRRR